MPTGEITVMVVTVAVVVATHNLAIGVVGTITAMVIFARRVAHLVASSNDLVYQFDYANDPDKVVIDHTDAHIWDASPPPSPHSTPSPSSTQPATKPSRSCLGIDHLRQIHGQPVGRMPQGNLIQSFRITGDGPLANCRSSTHPMIRT